MSCLPFNFVKFCKQRQEYVKYAKIIPLARLLNVKIPSKWYRRVVGGLEILCGIALTFIPHSKTYFKTAMPFSHWTTLTILLFSSIAERTKQVANVILLMLMVGAIFLHWMVDDKLERSAPALVFFFMLTCRLVVEWQLQRQAKAEAKLATQQQQNPKVPAKLAKSD